MSRLDSHVTKVQGKMLATGILRALAWSLLVYGGVVWITLIITRLFGMELPRQWIWFYSGLGVAAALAIAYAVSKRPSREVAAAEIDERLGLKEKFSTALYVRQSKDDPFAVAAVRDAETTAERVHLQDKFPIRFPRPAWFTAAMAVVVVLTGWLLVPMDLLGRKAEAAKLAQQEKQDAEVRREVKEALAKIESASPLVKNDEKIQLATRELKQLLTKPVKDPTTASRTAQNAMDDVKAQAAKIKEMQNAAQAMNEMKAWKEMSKKPIDESGPVGKAQSALQKGEFTKAIDLLKSTVENFDKMEQPDKDKAAQQMQQMAQQIKQMANDPQTQKDMEKQLQQMGATQQQAQQMAQKMQQAANGDKQAQQQMQQMANQMMQQMNNGQGPSQQQMQQAQGLINQLQKQAQGQAQAQQLAQNAQKMAQAMQQAAQQGQPGQQQGQKGSPQQANGQQQAGQQQAGQQQGSPGQQQAQQQMKQQLAEMQAMAEAAQQGGAGQGQQQGGSNQPGGQEPGGQQANAQGQGQPGGAGQDDFHEGDPNRDGGNGDGQGGGPGRASGRRADPREAPFAVKQELSKSETLEKGKILASNFVKASSFKGDSKAQLQEVLEANETEATDEVDQTRVSRQAREAVKEYNRSIAEDAAAATK